MALNSFRAYNKEQMLAVKAPGANHHVLITEIGEVSKKSYADPRGNQALEFDHIKQSFTGQTSSYKGDGSVESLRAEVESAIDSYVNEHYFNGHSTTYGKDGQVIVCISACKFDPDNFWYL